jgi:electron transport complex protein RnfB
MSDVLRAILSIGAIGLILGVLIGVANKYLEVKAHPLVQKVYDELPHFNCGACGTPGCMANAEEIVFKNQPLESCKPGNADMRKRIKRLIDEYHADEANKENTKT